jgi:hypothetical protein
MCWFHLVNVFDVETKLEMVSNFADLIEIYVLEPF